MKKSKTIVLIHGVDVPQQGAIDLFYYTKYLKKSNIYNVYTICNRIHLDEKHEYLGSCFIETGYGYGSNVFSACLFTLKAMYHVYLLSKKENLTYVHFFSQHPCTIFIQIFVTYILKLQTVYDIISGPIGTGWRYHLAKRSVRSGVYLSTKYVVDHAGLIDLLALPEDKSHVSIAIGYEENKITSAINKINVSNEGIVYMYIGSLHEDRELASVVEAFHMLNKKDSKHMYHIYFIGRGNDEKRLQNISGDGLNSYIHFLGYKPHHTISSYIQQADVLLSYVPIRSYFQYQPPTKLIEGLGAGKPVLATRTIAQEDILKEYSDLLCDDTVISLTEKIVEISSKDIMDTYSEEAMKKMVASYTRQSLIFDHLIPLYDSD